MYVCVFVINDLGHSLSALGPNCHPINKKEIYSAKPEATAKKGYLWN